MRTLHALALVLCALSAPAGEVTRTNSEPPLRMLHDGRVADFSGIYQLSRILYSYAAEAAAFTKENHRPPALAKDESAKRAVQERLYRHAQERYGVDGIVAQVGANGVYVERQRLAFDRTTGIVAVPEIIFLASFPTEKLIDGARISTWAYPNGTHQYTTARHTTATVRAYDWGVPYTGKTNELDSFIRLLPTGETNIIVRP